MWVKDFGYESESAASIIPYPYLAVEPSRVARGKRVGDTCCALTGRKLAPKMTRIPKPVYSCILGCNGV